MGNTNSVSDSTTSHYHGPCDCLISRKVVPGAENADVIIVDNGHIRTENPVPHKRQISHPVIINANGHLPIAASAYVNAASVGSNLFEKFDKTNCPICLLLIGLEDSGKTSFLQTVMRRYPSKTKARRESQLRGADLEDPKPTLGFSKESIFYRKHDIVIHDLGGRSTIRGIWKNYFAEAHGIVLVLDSSMHVTNPKWDELNEVLESLTENDHVGLHGKPTVILLNKQDVRPTIGEAEVRARVDLKEFLEKYALPYKVFPVCAREKELIKNTQSKRQVCYKNIEEALLWVVHRIEDSYPSLHMKVQLDSRSQIEREEEERRERAAKFKAAREAMALEEESEGKEDDAANPFVPIDEHLKKVEKQEHLDDKNSKEKPANGVLKHQDSTTEKEVSVIKVQPNSPKQNGSLAVPLHAPITLSTLSISKSEPFLAKSGEDNVSDVIMDLPEGDFSRQEERWSSVVNLKALSPNETAATIAAEKGDIVLLEIEETKEVSKLKTSRPPVYKRKNGITDRRFSLK